MQTDRMVFMAETAAQCAAIGSQPKPFGAFIQSKYFSGGFSFHTIADAAQWVEQQHARAVKDGDRSDFRAAISAADGQSLCLFS